MIAVQKGIIAAVTVYVKCSTEASAPLVPSYYYASVGGATGHTVVGLCICLCVCVCLSVGRISRRSLKTKR